MSFFGTSVGFDDNNNKFKKSRPGAWSPPDGVGNPLCLGVTRAAYLHAITKRNMTRNRRRVDILDCEYFKNLNLSCHKP